MTRVERSSGEGGLVISESAAHQAQAADLAAWMHQTTAWLRGTPPDALFRSASVRAGATELAQMLMDRVDKVDPQPNEPTGSSASQEMATATGPSSWWTVAGSR